MKNIRYEDFSSPEEIIEFFDGVFCTEEYGGGFIKSGTFAGKKGLSETFLDFFRSGDFKITEYDYAFNHNIDRFTENSIWWEYLEENFSEAGKKIWLLRKNAAFIFESSEMSPYILGLKVENKKRIISEIAGKIAVLGSTDFTELMEIRENHDGIINEIFFFPFIEEDEYSEEPKVPDMQKFYSITFNSERIKKYREDEIKKASDIMEKLMNTLNLK
ncbi:MAG: hypothetical protein IKL57_07920 [Oscillospiraceae bacterium]|nr:hypothetical protein [Oscillospiraceae bacterium]